MRIAAAPGRGLRQRLGLAVLQLAPALCLLAVLDAGGSGGSPVPDRAHNLHPHNRAGRSSLDDDSSGGTPTGAALTTTALPGTSPLPPPTYLMLPRTTPIA